MCSSVVPGGVDEDTALAALTKTTLWTTALADPRSPHLPMALWCVQQRAPLAYETAEVIGATGDAKLVEAFAEAYGQVHQLLCGAAGAGDVDLAISIAGRLDASDLGRFRRTDGPHAIGRGGSIELAQRLIPDPAHWKDTSWTGALRSGNLAFMKWGLSFSPLVNEEYQGEFLVCDAVESGNIELVRWLVEEKGYYVTEEAVMASAGTGQLDMLRWVYDETSCHIEAVLDDALQNGQECVIPWLVEQGCSLDEETLYEAAENSTPAVVACLLDLNCPYDETTLIDHACKNSMHNDVLPYLAVTRGMKVNVERCRTLEHRHHRTVDTFLFTHHGIPFSTDYLADCVGADGLQLVRFALANNAPLNHRAFEQMFSLNEVAMVRETILAHTTDGRLTQQLCDMLDEAIAFAQKLDPLSMDMVRELASFKYQPAVDVCAARMEERRKRPLH